MNVDVKTLSPRFRTGRPCRTCAELFQVVAETDVQLSYLDGDPERGDKPRCKAGVNSGAGRQCFRRNQLITGQLGPAVAVRTGGEATAVGVYTCDIARRNVLTFASTFVQQNPRLWGVTSPG